MEKNIVYGMYSGLALLLDVHVPDKPNGRGIVFIAGSGWQAPTSYDAVALKDNQAQVTIWIPPLLNSGFTVFAVNHRAAPRFHYPAAVDDIQRAVRFVRFHARDYGIDPGRIGGMGGSSGGHLMGLVSMLAAPGLTGDPDPVNREPATIQCVVLRAAPCDLRQMAGAGGLPQMVSFMELPPLDLPYNQKVYAEASPVTHVTAQSPPILLLHGDQDKTVPFQQSVAMEAALRKSNVPVKLLRLPGGEHGPGFETVAKPHPDWPDYVAEMVAWFGRHLK